MLYQIEKIIETAEKFRNAYFWNPPSSAGGRRSYEKYYSCPLIEWDENGHRYTAEYTVSCSCHNVYASGIYTRDGKKTTLTAIKNSYKRMKEAAGV
jgi:hypothetical protein